MNEIYDGDHLEDDLDAILADPETSADVDLINAFLDEIAGSDDAKRTLTQWPGEHSPPHFNVKGIDCFQKKMGLNCYRIRPLSRRLKQYRIIFALDVDRDDFYLLAIVRKRPDPFPANADPKKFYNYEPSHQISIRISEEYESLRLRKLC